MLALALLPAVLAVPGCNRPVPPSGDAASVAPPLGEESEVARFFRLGPPQTGSSRAAIMSTLGEPDSVESVTVANRHDPSVTDSIFTLHYDGISAVVYRAGYDGKEILVALDITDARHLQASAPVRIGTTSEDVVATLGEPSGSSAEHLEYTCEECLISGHETVRFLLHRGAVSRIEVRYWID
ncbi:hypothetical protein BH23GEM9_BH23GEM9_35730 [soil metagenome]